MIHSFTVVEEEDAEEAEEEDVGEVEEDADGEEEVVTEAVIIITIHITSKFMGDVLERMKNF
jgi:hypothetical protein